MTALSCILVLVVWQGESIMFSWNETYFLQQDSLPASLTLGKSLEMLCHSLNFGIHAVAMFVFAYYRSAQDLKVFAERKIFHGFIQLAFALMSLYQFVLGVWAFHPLVKDLPNVVANVPAPFWYYLVRFFAHLLNAICYFRTKITTVGFSDPVDSPSAVSVELMETGEEAAEPEEEVGVEGQPNDPATPPALTSTSTEKASAGAGNARLAEFMKSVAMWEWDSKVSVYLFFFGIVVLSAAVLAYETFVIDTAMVVGRNFHPSELGTLSVTYTVFYHFLFIVTGYGLRAVLDRNVLFLDVYRMALASATMVLLGYNILVLRSLPPHLGESGDWLVLAYNQAQIWIPVVLLFLSTLSFVFTTVYNRRIERIGFSHEATHM